MHLAPLIRDLAIILGTAGVVALIFKTIRQPIVLGYLVAGMIVGPHTPPVPLVTDLPNIQVWAELGVIFLMFSLGLEFTFHKLTRVGRTASGTAVVEVLGMVGLGYLTGKCLGWTFADSLFLGGMLAISSTTIIIKALDSLGLRNRRFAELVFGVLIVEDLVAILLLVALSTLAVTEVLFSTELLFSAAKLVLVVGSWFLIGYFFMPSFLKYAGKLADDETLTVIATGICLLLVVFAAQFHYSPALGAFIIGSILAETSEAHRIENLIRPLRDLFAAIFFVSVGMLMDPKAIWDHRVAVLCITAVTIGGKIVFSTLGALITGQTLKRSVQIGFSLAQIGEFSFIIAALGVTLKVTSDFLYPVAVAVSVITTFTTPYLIRVSEPCAEFLERNLPARVKSAIARYCAWIGQPRPGENGTHALKHGLFRFVLNGILVTVILLAADEYVDDWLATYVSHEALLDVVVWMVGILVAAPFIWGMFFAFRPLRDEDTGASRPPAANVGFYFFMGQLVTVLWLGILSLRFFPTGVSFVITLLGAGLIFVFFYRRLEDSYRWFERRFLSNIKPRSGQTADEAYMNALAPWELRLVKVDVHPDSLMVGQTLLEANIRGRFGLNIVVIRRGSRVIASPKASDRLLPGDELLILATDEQVDRFSAALEPAHQAEPVSRDLSDFALKQFVVTEGSPMVGQTIRDSRIRETFHGLVVGLERNALRTINPDPGLALKVGDRLWVVGGLI